MKNKKVKIRNKCYISGFTLIEMIVAIIINMIVIFGVGMLLIGGNRSWQKCYNSANNQCRIVCHM